jgi:hypothetical protein
MKEIIKIATIGTVLILLFGLCMVNNAQAEHISTLQNCIASRDSLINKLLNDMELIYLEK